ncbi:hypothetical protein ACLOJK_017921 [Asimina triloba]
MEYRPLELTIISANDLNDVNLFSKMDVYVVVSLSTDPRAPQRTPVDRDGGKSPKWNYSLQFSVPDGPPPILTFLLRSDRTLGDRDIGQVHVPVKELLDTAAKGDFSSSHSVTYQVRKPSGKPKGALNFSFKFGEKAARQAFAPPPPQPAVASSKGGEEPVMAYPPAAGPSAYPPSYASYPPPGQGHHPQGAYAPPAGHGYGGYPPPPHAGYGYPPPTQGYGYPPPPQGYGYPPMVAPPQKPKKNKMGLGLGAGLLGGALGGLLIGDMISDSADTGYDGGFDDGGGFDF